MSSMERMISNLSLKHSKKLFEVCNPLYTYFHLNGFFLTRTYDNGSFFSIGSNSAHHEQFFQGRCFKESPLITRPQSFSSGIYFYDQLNVGEFQSSLDELALSTNTQLLMGCVERNQTYTTRFGYCASLKHDRNRLIPCLINHIPLLHKFNEYFVEEMQSLILEANEYALDLSKELGGLYNPNPDNTLSSSLDWNSKSNFLLKVGAISQLEELTKREQECLSYIAKGLTSSNIGKKMFVSKRTVEHYIENLKQKLNVSSKSELILLGQLLTAV